MKPARLLAGLSLVAAGFILGFGYGRWYGPRPAATALKENAVQLPGRATPGSASRALETARSAALFHCPMHPNYISDKPGDCPICGMKLVPLETPEQAGHALEGRGKVLYYRDPQDSDYTSDEPGLNPATGRRLEPVYEGGMSAPSMGTIRISPEKQQLVGVTYGTAEATAAVQTIRSVGKVEADESRIAKVQTRVDGWIDKVFVDFTGRLVERGQPLLTLYSPEMLASQQEYLLALRSREVMRSSPLAGALQQGDALVAAARRRLELWDLSDSQVDEVARTGKPITNVTIYSPVRGYVMMRNAFPKQRISPETDLYTIADLDSVWIMADVYESDAPQVRPGMPARVRLSYTGQGFAGRVDYIQPQVDPMTRTLKVRINARNRGLVLKPDMYVDVEFEVAMARRVRVPLDAVLDSGTRKTVFVDRGNGYLEPRQVETGEQVGDRIEIIRGLEAGERIVTSGNFLIDSESQLKAAASGMVGHVRGAPAGQEQPKKGGAPPAPQGAHRHE